MCTPVLALRQQVMRFLWTSKGAANLDTHPTLGGSQKNFAVSVAQIPTAQALMLQAIRPWVSWVWLRETTLSSYPMP